MDNLEKKTARIQNRKFGFGCDGLEEVRFELTNHCGYKCFFCPRDHHTRSQGIMSVEDLEIAISRVDEFLGRPFAGEVHLSGYGESFLDKSLPEKAAVVKKHWPGCRNFVTSTLGTNMSEEFLETLAPNLDRIHVSFYSHTPEAYKELTGVNKLELARKNLERFVEARNRLNPHMLIEVKTTLGDTEKHMDQDPSAGRQEMEEWLNGLDVVVWDTARLHNYGSSRVYQDPPKKQICSIVKGTRSKILQITWDLGIVPCCFDFNAEMDMGSIRDNTLEEVLTGELADSLVKAHLARDLKAFPICEMCVSQGRVEMT